jgi:hypothetical protein
VIEPIPIALFFAIAMAVGWHNGRRHGFLVLALLWLAYSGYEYLMYKRVLCSGECNIRVDLLLIYPALFGSTLWVVIVATIRWVRRTRAGLKAPDS